MSGKLYAITLGELEEALQYLPASHREGLLDRFQLVGHRMFDSKGRLICGHYDGKTDTIIIYAYSKSEIHRKSHWNIIWHEVAHRVFEKMLSKSQKVEWQLAREKDAPFPIELSDIYSGKRLWEEEFCFIYTLIIRERFYKENDMKTKLTKNRNLQEQIPKRSKFVKKIVKDTKSKMPRKSQRDGCYKEAEDRFEKWAGELL